MRILLVFALALGVALTPRHARAQEEEEDEENSSFEQSTEDSSDETTAESTNQPSRNTTDPSVEVLEPTLGGGREPTESEGEHTDGDRAAAVGISALSVALVFVAVVVIAANGRDPAPVTPPPATPHEKRAAQWLGENDEQLRIDLARGEGPTLDDLAAAFALRPERRGLFAAAMRKKRGRLLATLDASSPETARVRGLLREVSDAMREDDALRGDWEHWRMTYGIAAP